MPEEIVLKAGLLIKDVHSELIFREAYEYEGFRFFPLSLRIAIVEMSLLRSEAGLNCFIRSSAGLRLEAAEREEKERTATGTDPSIQSFVSPVECSLSGSSLKDARGVGSCPRSKAFARVGEPGGQSLAVGAVLRLCTIELVATIRMTRCDTSHSSKKETEWTGGRKFSYRNGSRGLAVLPTLERRAPTQLRQPREHLSLYFWNEIGTSDKINFDSHVAKKATSSSGSLCLSPASIFWACRDQGSNSLNLWRTQEAKCAHFSQIAFEIGAQQKGYKPERQMTSLPMKTHSL
ncbi:hypothetical protein V6N12_075940 [Hibiscus sabdariffa]|uniref:Uncharacterized protein n=1 Tax=Hibiscus sabdariffa TaxID=183260 RepID=A0ABR2AXS0_9ROSI